MKILNIFCDASIKPDKLDPNNTLGCAGCICVDGDNIIDSENAIINSTTNNESEISAVLLAVKHAYKYRNDYDVINIFSDSKICVYGLREWIFKWKLVNNTFYGSSNTPIMNQKLFLSVVLYIIDNKIDYINLYHQKGHVTNTEDSILNALRVFKESNGFDISVDDVKYISNYNNIIDENTKAELLNAVNDKNKKLLFPVAFNVNKDLIHRQYRSYMKHPEAINI